MIQKPIRPNKESLGDRMKNNYEVRSQTYLPRRTYSLIRLDGRSFHNYTKNCKRPYDLDLMSDIDDTAKYLCENIQGCKIAYMQSDEITIILTDFDTIQTDAWFDGNVQKIASISASLATAKFNQLRFIRAFNQQRKEFLDCQQLYTGENSFNLDQPLAQFDSRCWVIPDPIEVHNCLVWRQQDATRNSIQMTGQSQFSHKELQHKSCDEIQEMLWSQKNINWNDMPAGFKRGRCVIKEIYEAPAVEMATEKQLSNNTVTRHKWSIIEPPIFTQEPDWIWNHVPKII